MPKMHQSLKVAPEGMTPTEIHDASVFTILNLQKEAVERKDLSLMFLSCCIGLDGRKAIPWDVDNTPWNTYEEFKKEVGAKEKNDGIDLISRPSSVSWEVQVKGITLARIHIWDYLPVPRPRDQQRMFQSLVSAFDLSRSNAEKIFSLLCS